MKRNICAVRDRQMAAFGQPIFVPTTGIAIRSFADEINNPQSEMHKHPDDYDLYHLGTFDDDTGRFENLDSGPTQIALGKNLLQK